MRVEISQQELKLRFHYDPESGIFTRTKATRLSPVGQICGHKLPSGYLSITIDGLNYRAHRLAWFYMHGTWPNPVIDHINGVPDDNRLTDLREATHSENNLNRTSKNKTGLRGVYRRHRGTKWGAKISINKVEHHLGYFETPEQAAAAYMAAREIHYPTQPFKAARAALTAPGEKHE